LSGAKTLFDVSSQGRWLRSRDSSLLHSASVGSGDTSLESGNRFAADMDDVCLRSLGTLPGCLDSGNLCHLLLLAIQRGADEQWNPNLRVYRFAMPASGLVSSWARSFFNRRKTLRPSHHLDPKAVMLGYIKYAVE
jgi:hypothetical protein